MNIWTVEDMICLNIMICMFINYIRNDDGCISVKFFYLFICKFIIICEPLYMFRIALINRYFPGERVEIILNRKMNIQRIKSYQQINHSYPSEGCIKKFYRLLKGDPPIFRYDYTSEIGEINYSDIVTSFIQKYKPSYIFIKEPFSLKYLTIKSPYKMIDRINNFFLSFKKQTPAKYSKYSHKDNSGGSSLLISEFANSGKVNTRSILKSNI